MRCWLFWSISFLVNFGHTYSQEILADTSEVIRLVEAAHRKEIKNSLEQDSLLDLAIKKSSVIERNDYVVRIYQHRSFLKHAQNDIRSALIFGRKAVNVAMQDGIQKEDILRNAVTNLAYCYLDANKFDSCHYWIDYGKKLCMDVDNFNLSILTTLEAVATIQVGKTDAAMKLFEEAKTVAGLTPSLHDDVMAVFNLTSALQTTQKGGWEKSVEMLTAFRPIVEKQSLDIPKFRPYQPITFYYRNAKTSLYLLLGINAMCLFDYDNACNYYQRVIQEYKSKQNRGRSYVMFDLATLELMRDSIKTASVIYDSALHLMQMDFGKNEIPFQSFYFLRGWFAERDKKYNGAIQNYKQAIRVADTYFPILSMPALLRSFVRSGDMIRADSLVQAVKFNDQAHPVELFWQILFKKEQSDYYRKKGNNLLATQALLKHYQVKDSLLNKARYQAVKEVETRFKIKEKDTEILLANREKELSAVELSRKKEEMGILAVGFVALVILSVTLLRIYLGKKQQAKILADRNNRIELLIRELHHRVKNNMQTISSLLSLQSYRTADESAKIALREGQARVDAMSLIHQKLYLEEDLRVVNMEEYVNTLVKMLAHSYGFDPQIVKSEIATKGKSLDVDVAIPLGLIINELIVNSFKYAFESIEHPELRVILKQTDSNQVELVVSDNGVGLSRDQGSKEAGTSFGLKLVQTLSKQLGGTFTLQNKEGVVFQLVVPV